MRRLTDDEARELGLKVERADLYTKGDRGNGWLNGGRAAEEWFLEHGWRPGKAKVRPAKAK